MPRAVLTSILLQVGYRRGQGTVAAAITTVMAAVKVVMAVVKVVMAVVNVVVKSLSTRSGGERQH